MDLSRLSLAELRTLQEQVKQSIKAREQEEVAKARQQILAIAQSVGIPLNELLASQVRVKTGSKASGKPVAVRYRHPSNSSLHWTGRGRQPKWLKDWVGSGQSLDDLRV